MIANEPAEGRREAGEGGSIIEPCKGTVQAEKNLEWSRHMFVR